ncbi:DUF262 domain-containing protein [Deinococcus aluminii]|uniref:GmrSD restriction endonucleases N-terminal domain-containing protein n=1 Tax=Deinococcus aluminii TaxID=1656885 RepID=A0ABP9XGY3_9DEIO
MTPSEDRKRAAEEQIRTEQTVVDYNTLEYTVELVVGKYTSGLEEDENELYIPDYQRDFVWAEERKSKFIESIILGIPIPYVFTAALSKDIEEDLGRVEIVDGSQRIRTLTSFIKNEFALKGLKKLDRLNGFYFKDLDLSRQRRILRRPIRVIELSEKANEETRRDIFERINTGSDELNDMEKRKGISYGPFYNFLKECADDPLFKDLCPITPARAKREEGSELVLRFFAYRYEYLSFDGEVSNFLNDYMQRMSADNGNAFDREVMSEVFQEMLHFVRDNFPFGFRKSARSKSVPRMRFEAISVGTSLALETKSPLNVDDIPDWLESDEFKSLTQDDAGNRPHRLKGRIEFVRDHLIKTA